MDITVEDITAVAGAILGVAAVAGLVGQVLVKPFIRSNTKEISDALVTGLQSVQKDVADSLAKVTQDVASLERAVTSNHTALTEHMTQERVTTALIQQQLTSHEGSISTMATVMGMQWRKGPEWPLITSPVMSGEPQSVSVQSVITPISEGSSSTTQ